MTTLPDEDLARVAAEHAAGAPIMQLALEYALDPLELALAVGNPNPVPLSEMDVDRLLELAERPDIPDRLLPTYRFFDCPLYARCNEQASDEGWRGFACGLCPEAEGVELLLPLAVVPRPNRRRKKKGETYEIVCRSCGAARPASASYARVVRYCAECTGLGGEPRMVRQRCGECGERFVAEKNLLAHRRRESKSGLVFCGYKCASRHRVKSR